MLSARQDYFFANSKLLPIFDKKCFFCICKKIRVLRTKHFSTHLWIVCTPDSCYFLPSPISPPFVAMARTKQTSRGDAGGKAPRQTLTTKSKSKGKTRFSKKSAPGIKKSRKFRPGTVALRDIKKYQRVTDMLLRRLPFQRLVRDLTTAYTADAKFAAAALLALQEATESYVTKAWEHCGLLAVHAKRVTVLKRDWTLCLKAFRPDLQTHAVPRSL